MPAVFTMPKTLNYAEFPKVIDYDQLVEPYVPDVHDVLTGRKARFKLRYHDATIVFHHGCLLTRLAWKNEIFALPPFEFDETGHPALRLTSEQAPVWLESLFALPRDIRLFYFTLLKAVFDNQPLVTSRSGSPERTISVRASGFPCAMRSLLAEVGWAFS